MSAELLQMKKVNKYFGKVHVLKDVDFELDKGQVHALLGENGAGKSTLINIIGGFYKIDSVEIYIDGKKEEINSVDEATKCGISIIHQELVLEQNMSIAENIFLHREYQTKYGFLDKKRANEETKKLLQEFNIDVAPTTLINKLTAGQQQMIEIITAVSVETKILVMDEPTSSLSDQEVQLLFDTVRHLKAKGVGIIYISHRLSELSEIADKVTVLRDGQYIGTKDMDKTSQDELVSMMVGRSLENFYVRTYNEPGEVVLDVKGLTSKAVKNVSFSLRKGEILGFSGLLGSGRTESMRCIMGLDPFDSGEICINGQKVKIKDPEDAVNLVLALVPENRKTQGIFPVMDIRFNTTIRVLDRFIKHFRVDTKTENKIVDDYVKKLNVKASSTRQKVGSLSGGNQQKVIIAKWLAVNPQILILDEPTKGIDVVAKSEIYAIMNDLVKQGVSIIMISSELPEIINMSDRVVVMNQGAVRGILERNELDQEKIMHYALGGQ